MQLVMVCLTSAFHCAGLFVVIMMIGHEHISQTGDALCHVFLLDFTVMTCSNVMPCDIIRSLYTLVEVCLTLNLCRFSPIHVTQRLASLVSNMSAGHILTCLYYLISSVINFFGVSTLIFMRQAITDDIDRCFPQSLHPDT
jgi:hypothetical protein